MLFGNEAILTVKCDLFMKFKNWVSVWFFRQSHDQLANNLKTILLTNDFNSLLSKTVFIVRADLLIY